VEGKVQPCGSELKAFSKYWQLFLRWALGFGVLARSLPEGHESLFILVGAQG